MRVVSLVPSITETVRMWPPARLVGVTRFCDAPGVETVGGTKNPDIQAIIALRPDVVFMDKEENRAADAEALEHAGVRVVATDVRDVRDVNPTMDLLARAVGFGGVTTIVLPAIDASRRKKVFVPIWRRPWMTVSGSTYGSSLLSAVGLDNVFATSARPYPEVTLEEVAGLRPDFVLAPSEPYVFAERHRPELEQVAPVVFVDGRDLFWWGGRTVAATERLARMAKGLSGA